MSSSSNVTRGAPPPRRWFKSAFDLLDDINNSLAEQRIDLNPEYDVLTAGQKWMDDTIQNIITNVLMLRTFSMYVDGKQTNRNYSKNNLEKIARRYLIFFNLFARNAFRYHKKGMYAEANGVFVEFTANVNRRAGSDALKRGSFDMKKMESKLSSWMSWEIIFSEATSRMKNTRISANSYYPYIYNSNCRGIFQAIYIHLTGFLGMACTMFQNNMDDVTPKHPSMVISQMFYGTTQGDGERSLSFDVNMKSMNYFRDFVWNEVMDDMLRLAKRIYDWWIYEIPTGERTRYGRVPAVRRQTSEKLYIKNMNYDGVLKPAELVRKLLSEDPECVDFWAKMASHLFRIFLVKGHGLFYEIMEGEEFDLKYRSAIEHFYNIIYELLVSSLQDGVELLETANQTGQQFIDSVVGNRETWLERVINRVRTNPIRYIEQEELNSLLRQEEQTRTIVNIVTPETTTSTTENETVIDLDATVDKFDEANRNKNLPNTRRIVVIAVEDPPAECLDDSGKCKSCRIDWSKLNGRVQIIRCPSGVNVEVANDIIERTINSATKSIQQQIEEHSSDGGEHSGDERRRDERRLQLTVPTGNSNEQVEIESRVIDRLVRFPITITDGLRNLQGNRLDNTSLLESTPDILHMLLHRIATLASRRRLTGPSSAASEPNVDNNVIPSEFSVALSEVEEADTDGGEQKDGQNRRVQINVEKKVLVPVVPDNVIEEIIDEAGLGPVNESNELSFSSREANEEVRDVARSLPSRRQMPMLQSVFVRREDDVPPDQPITITVEGLDATNAHNFTYKFLLTKWIKERRFEHSRLDSAENWSRNNIFCTAGPLSFNADFNKSKCEFATFRTVRELIGTYAALTSFDLYYQIHDALSTPSNWDDVGHENELLRFHGDENRKGLTYMLFRVPLDERIGRYLSLYSIVVVYQYNRRTISGNVELLLTRRRFGLVTELTTGYDGLERCDIVRILDITEAQPSRAEHAEQQYIQRYPRDEPVYFCYIKNVGYVGSSFRYSDYHNSIMTRSSRMTNLMLHRATINNQYRQIRSLSNNFEANTNDIIQYVNSNCFTPFRRDFLHLLFGLTKLTNPTGADIGHTIRQDELPALPMPAQITAIVKCCQCIDENMKSNVRKVIDSEVITICGPAGTGKTTTLGHVINAILNIEGIADSIVHMYNHIERIRQGEETLPLDIGTKPEDSIRILLVTESNQALEELEALINRGMLFKHGETSLRPAIPLYSKVATRHNSQHELVPQIYEVPDPIKMYSTGTLTLTTVGSMQKAFMNQQLSRSRQSRGDPQYDVVIIDEASQVGMRSWIITSVLTQVVSRPSSKVTFIVCGDPHQNPPMSFGFRSAFTKLASVSIVDMFIPTSPTKVQSFSPWIQLNVQFRMHPLISDMSNCVANRTVITHPSVLQLVPPTIDNPSCHHVNDNFEPVRPNYTAASNLHLFHPIVWVNPYNCTIPIRSMRLHNEPRMFNTSIVEAATTVNIVRNLLEQGTFQHNQILVLTPYNTQVQLIRSLLDQVHNNLGRSSPRNAIIPLNEVAVSTVGSIQGAESDCVIFSTVRNRNNRGEGIGIVGDMHTIYVAITRARFKLYFVGDNGHLGRFAIWKDLIGFLGSNVDRVE